MTPPRREPLIPRRHNLATSVLCEAIADTLDNLLVTRTIPLTTGQIDAIAAGIARSLSPAHLLMTRTDGCEIHRLTIDAEVDW